jgi:hypothetical protein
VLSASAADIVNMTSTTSVVDKAQLVCWAGLSIANVEPATGMFQEQEGCLKLGGAYLR